LDNRTVRIQRGAAPRNSAAQRTQVASLIEITAAPSCFPIRLVKVAAGTGCVELNFMEMAAVPGCIAWSLAWMAAATDRDE
jgi:hypothetical protein